ncbi:MAG: PH domain-containing protein [Salinivirgaceae bacterium]|jgi:putative membrane protein|nr:PH domain-containing protein [Salinivirgaceae bacterium]
MKLDPQIIEKAEFNPNIKTYILLSVAFFVSLSVVGIPLLLVWFFGLGQFISSKFYKSLRCQLTERHLEFAKGVLFKKEKTIPLENIQDLTFIQNPLLSLLDLRILKIETAAQSNKPGISDMRLVGIIDALEFKAKVLDQRTKIIKEDRAGGAQTVKHDNESVLLLREIRDLLKNLNVKS